MKKFGSVAALLCAVALTSCEKNAVQDITGIVPGGRVKFFNFGVSAPGVNFYADATKMTAVNSTAVAAGSFVVGLKYIIVTVGTTDFVAVGAASSTVGVTFTATGVGAGSGTAVAESTTGIASGGVGNGGFYSAIVPGQYTFSGKIAAAVDKDLAIATLPATAIDDGKFYSVYLSGIYNTTAKSSEIFIVEDTFGATIDYTVAYVRFVNTISNSTPQTLYAKPATGTEVAVGGAIAYKSAGAFTSVPAGVYDLNTRTTGSSANAISRTAVSFSAGRVYTIGSRGDMTVVSTTLATRPQLDNTLNR